MGLSLLVGVEWTHPLTRLGGCVTDAEYRYSSGERPAGAETIDDVGRYSIVKETCGDHPNRFPFHLAMQLRSRDPCFVFGRGRSSQRAKMESRIE